MLVFPTFASWSWGEGIFICSFSLRCHISCTGSFIQCSWEDWLHRYYLCHGM